MLNRTKVEEEPNQNFEEKKEKQLQRIQAWSFIVILSLFEKTDAVMADSQEHYNSSVSVINDTVLEAFNDEMARKMIPAMVFLGVLMVFGTFGNAAVCYFFGWKSRKSLGSRFIFTLSIYDILLCLLGLPFEILDIRFSYTFTNGGACKFMRFVDYFVAAGSIFTLLVIAVDRYRKICKPLKSQIRLRETNIMCALSVPAGIFFSWPALICFDAEQVDVVTPDGTLLKGHDCTSRRDKSFKIYIWIGIGFYFISLLVSAVILFVMYGLAGWALHKRAQKPKDLNDDNTTNSHKNSDDTFSEASKRFTWMMLAISVVFFLSFVPFIALAVRRGTMKEYEDDDFTTAEQIGWNIGFRSMFLNSAINPFIYGLFNKNFRALCLPKLNCSHTSKNSPDISVAGMSTESSRDARL